LRVLLFGTGEYYNRYKIWFENEMIVALIDNSVDKQGKLIDSVPVVSPEQAIGLEFDAIFIMSFYVVSMKRQLIELGVEEDKIHHFYDIHDLIYSPMLCKEVKYYGEFSGTNDKGILLINQDLTLGGPALALYHVAKVLVKNGYNVTYASMLDGPLREILEKDRIPVIVDLNLLVQTMNECEWIIDFSLIICNTINFHVFLSKRDTSVPVIWWLHDAIFFYDGVNRKAISSISKENLKVWAVGPVSESAIKAFRPDFKVEDLLYGVEDTVSLKPKKREKLEYVRFVTIGYIEERKGQDILIEAIKKLPEYIRNQTRFLFIGSNTSMFANSVMKEAEKIKEVEFCGLVDRDRINEVLSVYDMMVCPSREDPMPTVCAEAMSHGLPCIISDAAGTIKYIDNMINGVIFQSENVDDLATKIRWAVEHRNQLNKMGINARKVFENNFNMETFERNLLKLIEMG